MLSKIFSSALLGIDAFRVSVEVSVTRGLGYTITGLPDDAIKESLSRIAIAVQRSGFQMPRTKLVINLAPADTRKYGTAFDLPITLGILLATSQVFDLEKLRDFIVVGELGLDGTIFPVRGALCMTCQARKEGFRGIILPAANADEASLVEGIDVYGVSHLKDVLEFIQMDCGLPPCQMQPFNPIVSGANGDFRDVVGQTWVKRALEIAAAGGHNALLIGFPGGGKTMLASRLPSILPPLTADESLETTRIYSVGNPGENHRGLIRERPFRSPHHTSSDVSLAGGGTVPVPGEISLAHNGVLFLDELPEFKRSAIEVLRQPLEERKVRISRAKCSLEYPAAFMLVAAMNPCLCGYQGHPTRRCTCSRRAIYWYRRRISGPVLERIDLHIEAESPPLTEILNRSEIPESSAVIRERVIAARKIQTRRFEKMEGIHCNAQMPDFNMEEICRLDPECRSYALRQMDRAQLSLRSYTRVLKIARTIADLKGLEQIGLAQITEALSYRNLDRPIEGIKTSNLKSTK
jgi:magnesium chelatase family protein